MASERAEVNVGEARPVDLDFETYRWSAEREFSEGDFPLIATVKERRYEIYSDGTFAEEET